MADVPLVKGVAGGAGECASEVEEHHAGDAGGAVVDGGSEAEGAGAVAVEAAAGGRVGVGGGGAHEHAVACA